MNPAEKKIVFIAGPNGAGKTTTARLLLPTFFRANEFVNADEIAKGLSPFNPQSVNFTAGKIMLQRIATLMGEGRSLGIETTLSAQRHKELILEAKSKGYSVGIIFLYLNSVSLAKKRVQNRVSQGGHDIPPHIIERRYERGLKNLTCLYLPICDWAYITDNSSSDTKETKAISIKDENGFMSVVDEELWEKIKQ